MKRCSGKTKQEERCLNMSPHKFCHLHGQIGGGPEEAFKKWLGKEIKHIYRNFAKHFYVSYQDVTVYKKGNNVVIWSIEEDDGPDEYFITSGKYPNRLKVEKKSVRGKIETYIKKRYKKYRRRRKLDSVVNNALMEL